MKRTIYTHSAVAALAYFGGLLGGLAFLIVLAMAACLGLAAWQVAAMITERRDDSTASIEEAVNAPHHNRAPLSLAGVVPPPVPAAVGQVAAQPTAFDVLAALGLEVSNIQFKQPAKPRAAKSK